ncbi:hypothetical protein GCM10023205_04230 [Yinghuangia aomiensis]|uniref:Uncharacterized protein n=1 Tax=Yinghuangia aomiensis TaxID=676205 RepID=A0ABP9GLM4_9ACTN
MPESPAPIVIARDRFLGVGTITADPLVGALLVRAGFHASSHTEQELGLLDADPGRRYYNLPHCGRSEEIRAASHAAEMLRAARFQVDLDPPLYVGPTTTVTDPHGLQFAGAAILDATDLVAGADNLPAVCDALALVLDEYDGALARLTEFFEVAAEKAHAVGAPLQDFARDFEAAAQLNTQLWERLAEAADATRPTEPTPHDLPPSTAMLAARHSAAVRARAAGAPAVTREPVPLSANHRIAAPLPRPNPTALGGRR